MPIGSGVRHIESLPRSCEMNLKRARTLGQLKHFFPKLSHPLADKARLVTIEKAVTKELNENPIRPSGDANSCTAPQIETLHIKWRFAGNITGFNPQLRNRACVSSPIQN